MTALQVTALTDLLLASLCFFLAGALGACGGLPRSAAWYWRLSMGLLALAALLGGIDHGIVEPAGLPRGGIRRATWAVLGLMTGAMLLTLGAQFFGPARQPLLRRLAALQLAAFSVALVLADSFIVVVVAYLPIVLALLAFNLRGLSDGSGSGAIAAGFAVLLLASAVQALGIDTFSPIDHNGLYHLISMPGAVLLYLGGRRLKTAP